MRARRLSGLLKKGDRVAVTNITGREASKVTLISQRYANNIVGGWALAKDEHAVDVPGRRPIPVLPTCEALYTKLPKSRRPNKVVIYSPPTAVYGDLKEAIQYGGKQLQTVFVITENVSIEVTAKMHSLCGEANVDLIGCNTLGVINTHDRVRVGAVGGDAPEESFQPGAATIISNSGNMVNTIAGYLLGGGIGTHFGISTGKDVLIMTPLVELLQLAAESEATKLIVLYVEPGGLYEQQAIEWMTRTRFAKPVLVYVAGGLMEGRGVSLGHAGAVVEGAATSASGKAAAFDAYFGIPPFRPEERSRRGQIEKLRRGVRVTALHHLPLAAMRIYEAMGWKRDQPIRKSLKLNPWFVNLGDLAKQCSPSLVLAPGAIPEPYAGQLAARAERSFGLNPARRNMRNASHASSLDADSQRIHGLPLTDLMTARSFGEAVILYWTGQLPALPFEARLVEMCLTASLTNGPGTISAQAAKLSASAGNAPNTGMIATLAAIGDVHGGNGREGVRFLLKHFTGRGLADPYAAEPGVDLAAKARKAAAAFKKVRAAAKDAGVEYERIPGLGHPVFNTEPVNYDPRERAISKALADAGRRNVFLDFYHALARALFDEGVASRLWAVNMDAALASVWLAICWRALAESRITVRRVEDCAFLGFALGRAAGGAGEFLDHQDFGQPMDMRIPGQECTSLTPPRPLPAGK